MCPFGCPEIRLNPDRDGLLFRQVKSLPEKILDEANQSVLKSGNIVPKET